MRRITLPALLALVLLSAAPGALADVPATLSYQGILTDSDGRAVGPGPYTLMFRIYADPMAPPANRVYEQQVTTQVTDGLYNVVLSGASETVPTDLALAFDDVNQGQWMEVEIVSAPDSSLDGTVLSPRQQIASVPYALRAITVVDSQIPTREIEFVTSSYVVESGDDLDSGWTVLQDDTGTADLVATVTPPSAACTIEVSGSANFNGGNGKAVALALFENGTQVGVPSVAVADGGTKVAWVNKLPSAGTPHNYDLRASAAQSGLRQGSADSGQNAGAYIKVAMECAE